jgi:hypothetical protein
MTELDQVWSQMLADAGTRASEMGREHVAEYLRLKATNDAIRARGVAWLIDSFIEIAAAEQRGLATLTIERVDGHSFARGSSTMRGTLVDVRYGVRCLTIEAGWARGPRDGIMQKGALAYARISHFGMPKAGDEFRLVHARSLPAWVRADGDSVDVETLRRHFRVFLAA